jgi:hypothetical protein
MIAALWAKMNWKRFWMTSAVMFAWVFLSDMVIHGWLLGNMYHQTASLWRSEQEMQAFMGWMMGSQFIAAFFFSFIFTKGYENKGWQEGARYGLLMGLFSLSHMGMQFATTPLPAQIFWAWVSTGMIQFIFGGILASMVYKK